MRIRNLLNSQTGSVQLRMLYMQNLEKLSLLHGYSSRQQHAG